MSTLLFTIPTFNNVNDIIIYVATGAVATVIYFLGKKNGKRKLK